MLELGYIKLHRALKNWRWYQDRNVLCLWVHILLSANYDPCYFQDIEVGRGEFVTSVKRLADDTGMSVKEIRTALDKLKKTGEITVSSNRRYSVIHVAKYENYQFSEANSEANFWQSSGSQGANRGQTEGKPEANFGQSSGSQGATMKESKKARKQERVVGGASAPNPADRFSGDLLIAVQDWISYKAERRETYKPTGLKSLLTEIENRVARHGEQAVCDVIRLSMSNGWRGIIWDRIRQTGGTGTSCRYDSEEGSL